MEMSSPGNHWRFATLSADAAAPSAPIIMLSIALHIVFIWAMNHPVQITAPEPIFVSLEFREPKRQIVSPPQPEEAPPDKATTLLAERDSRAEREQIRRGDGGGKPGPTQPVVKQQPPTPAAPPAAQKVKYLGLDRETLNQKFAQAGTEKPRSQEQSPATATNNTSNYSAFSRPQGSGAAILGSLGTTDFLPQLPDGDITMLNAKANKYAVFVRRVATRVFGQLRSVGWERMLAADVNGIVDYARVKATLSMSGELLEVKIDNHSGSPRFDQVVVEAVRAGAADPNPPKEAALEDGNVHFIFQSKSWVKVVGDRRSGGLMERRWLLLGTGLE